MANYNPDVKAFTSGHNETLERSTRLVAPPSKQYKELILQQVVKEIKEESARAQATSSYGVSARVIRERQKDFPWINRNMVNYFIKVSKLQQGNKQQPASITIETSNADRGCVFYAFFLRGVICGEHFVESFHAFFGCYVSTPM